MSKLLYHTIYAADPWGHGGEKRVAQLAEICGNVLNQRELFQTDKSLKKPSLFSIIKAFEIICRIYPFRQFASFRVFLRFWKSLSIQYPSMKIFFKNNEKLFLWESTKDAYYFLPYQAKKHKKKVIALPHNLESLVPDQKSNLTGKYSPSGFLHEINILSQCDAVFSISRSETLILKLFNVNAYYLPYYPTTEIERYLLSIRLKRQKIERTFKKEILLLGSAINPPTRMGMENRIHFFKQHHFEDIELRIAGFGTSQLLPLISNTKNIKLLGELPVEQFEQELLHADAILIHQPATTGALIRIIEFLIAGIPIIANEESARNDFGKEGLWVYYDDQQLIDLLLKDLNEIPPVPSKPQFQIKQFECKVHEYIT